MDDCQILKTSSNGWLARFSVTIISTSFLWMDDFLSLFLHPFPMDDHHFFCIFQWTITTFPSSLPMGDCHSLSKEKIKTSWFGATKWF
jgi:hypothetical protein